MVLAVRPPRTETLTDIARRAYEECEHNREQAVALLWRWYTADAEFREVILQPAVQDLFTKTIRVVDDISRQAAWSRSTSPEDNTPEPLTSDQNKARLATLQEYRDRAVAKFNLYDYAIWGGKRLGNCTQADLATAIQHEQKHISTRMKHLRFIVAVAERVTDDKIVRDALTETDLEALQQQAEGE